MGRSGCHRGQPEEVEEWKGCTPGESTELIEQTPTRGPTDATRKQAGKERQEERKEGKAKRGRREANTEEKQGKGQEDKSEKHTKRRRKRVEPAATRSTADHQVGIP